MAIDANSLQREYFFFDKPVKYKLSNNHEIFINPVKVIDSEIFLSSVNLLMVDKNSANSIDIIQMSYLQFIVDVLFLDKSNQQRLFNLLVLCLGFKQPCYGRDDKNKPFVYEKGQYETVVSTKDFEDIAKIILLQNLPNYSDDYIDFDLRKAMNEVDELKSKNIEFPNLERKMAIITSHCGISKKEQMDMTLRSHQILFEEVCGEVKYTAERAIALYGGEGDKVEWIFKKKKGKFDDYITTTDDYAKSMGGKNGDIIVTKSSVGDSYMEQFNNF